MIKTNEYNVNGKRTFIWECRHKSLKLTNQPLRVVNSKSRGERKTAAAVKAVRTQEAPKYP